MGYLINKNALCPSSSLLQDKQKAYRTIDWSKSIDLGKITYNTKLQQTEIRETPHTARFEQVERLDKIKR